MAGFITSNVGDWWAPQKNFLECSGGMSISEWCSAARETCCALCPMPPISGPATTFVWTLSTFLNLIFTNLLTIEAPYNFMFQVAASEGALAALFFRTLQVQGLSAFHFYYVPLYVVSTVPVGLGAAMSSPGAFSGGGGGSIVEHGHIKGSFNEYEKDADHQPRRGKLMNPPRKSRKKMQEAGHPMPQPIYKHASLAEDPVFKPIPRPKLLLAVKGFIVVQLMLYIGIFSWVYFGTTNFTQAHCNKEFGIDGIKWRYFAMTFTFVLLGLVLAVLLFLAYPHNKRSHSVQMTVARLLHSRRAVDWTWQHENKLKWGVSIFFYLLWAGLFAGHHIMALQKFLLLGDDPFDFGQVNWIVSSFVVLGVIVRSVYDVRDTTAAKYDALLQDARKRHIEPRESIHKKIEDNEVFADIDIPHGNVDWPERRSSESPRRSVSRSRSSASRSVVSANRRHSHTPDNQPSGSTTIQGQGGSQSSR
ncbi:hypothetical protein OIV83_001449 [Microbotryomycetes sp. JL201]|nr:hypothetical protein OIV83_001449 [Microbotryomycetes sp. JL201]